MARTASPSESALAHGAAGRPAGAPVPPPRGWERRRGAIDRHLARRLATLPGVPERLAEALRYAVLGGGKRLRPQLVLLGAEAAGGRAAAALPAALAFEYVHAFSLVHDDLPAMDDDDWRRGRPTVHRRFDEATAILAGDALLVLAFEELTRLPRRGVPAERALEAVRVLAWASGARGMVAGQQLDMEAEGERPARETVERIHRHKTGALIAAALETGGVIAGAEGRQRRALAAIGADLGLAFQIVDDLLDRRSSRERLGKSVGADRNRGKATYPDAVGEEAADAEVTRLVRRVVRRARRFPKHAERIAEAARFVAGRET